MLIENIRDSIETLDFEHGVDSESTRAEITALQKLLLLNDYALPNFGPDGDYGGETITAVENYQRDHGLDVTGIAGPEMLQHMRDNLDGLNPDIALIEQQLRGEVMRIAQSFVGTVETGGDNNSPIIAEFLRSDDYSANQSGAPSAPLGAAWCAGFASYVMDQITPHITDYNVLAKGLMRQFDDQGAYYDMDSGYTPQPGDMIFFERGQTGDWRGHVGFIQEVREDGTIVAIEGNKHHPDYEDEDSYSYDPDRPDGVRIVEYSPEEFAEERMLGFGNTMELYALNVGLQNVTSVMPQETAPAISIAPSHSAPPLARPDF